MDFDINKEDWRKIGVYRISNKINNKIYIGSTTTNFRHRYLQYCSGFKKNINNQPILYKAFKKYGFDNFSFSLVCICDKEAVLKTEQFYIDKGVDYNSCLVAGSLQGFKHPKDSKTKTKIKGKHHSAVKVDMYSLRGDYIKSFDSMEEAKEETDIKSKSNISQCCKGKCFSAGGYRWALHKESLFNRDKREGGKIKVSIKKDNLYKEFNSQKEASDFIKSLGYKCNQARIQRSITKTGEKVYGFTVNKI